MNYRHLNKCPICGHKQLEHFLSCTDHYASGELFEILNCTQCGMKMTQDVPVETEIGRYYETPDYISHSDTNKGLMNRVYHWVRSYMLNQKTQLVEKVCAKKDGRVLDIGCGTGYFAHTMQSRGWQVEAIEKSADARAFAKKQFNLNVQDDSRINSFADRSFDAITLWHVMEHIEDLDNLWNALARQLKNNGRLVVAVPNSESHDARHYTAQWAAYDVPRHLWHFSADALTCLAERNGFERCSVSPMPFDAFYISMLSEKYKGNSLYFLKGLWIGLCCWLKAFGNVRQSSSLIYVFRKK